MNIILKGVKLKINTEEYWENRFKTDWKSHLGSEQSLLHYEILLEYLPDWIKDMIGENAYSICDMGCGLGEGTEELGKHFPNSRAYGMDFSKSAIDEASQNCNLENVSFFKDDIMTVSRDFDVIVTSHTLEHFKNPFEICENLVDHCRLLVITVPFREKNMFKEHEFYFDYSSFPLKIKDKRLLYFREIEPIYFKAGGYMMKEQILVIYGDEEITDGFSLDYMNSYYDEALRLKSKISKLKDKNKKLKNKNKKLKKENSEFKSSKAYKLWKRL